jgi:AcrR family transcriptional regulator
MSATAPTAIDAAAPARRGRPRRAGVDDAILDATLELLNEVGVAGLSMNLLAHRAGVAKATIYRRWVSKETLILDALRMTTTPIPVPDEGSLREDLSAYMDAVIACFAPGRGGSDVLPHLIEASCHDPQLRASLDDYTLGRQATIRLLLQRGIDRNELPADTDVDLLVDVILAPFFYHHLCTGATVDTDLTRRLVEFALR